MAAIEKEICLFQFICDNSIRIHFSILDSRSYLCKTTEDVILPVGILDVFASKICFKDNRPNCSLALDPLKPSGLVPQITKYEHCYKKRAWKHLEFDMDNSELG